MNIKEAKKNYVTDEAIKLFLKDSIATVTIRDVAKAAELGEATIYRYFSSKSGLIVACAIRLQKIVCAAFTDSHDLSNGYYRLEMFYNAYLKMFLERPELYRFLSEFDAFCISENIDSLEEYSDNMDMFKFAFNDAYENGVKDGSVNVIEDINTFYYSTTHAMLALCKKLSQGIVITRQDTLTDRSREIKMLIDIILASLKKR
ncbi:MAG: TetR/AcrR family transcriptional regulator [Clostridia bacterium]|nr:TetR/AcrR family transcriptional regulator [Clostridia bacterium]